jgi:hypothetical protein
MCQKISTELTDCRLSSSQGAHNDIPMMSSCARANCPAGYSFDSIQTQRMQRKKGQQARREEHSTLSAAAQRWRGWTGVPYAGQHAAWTQTIHARPSPGWNLARAAAAGRTRLLHTNIEPLLFSFPASTASAPRWLPNTAALAPEPRSGRRRLPGCRDSTTADRRRRRARASAAAAAQTLSPGTESSIGARASATLLPAPAPLSSLRSAPFGHAPLPFVLFRTLPALLHVHQRRLLPRTAARSADELSRRHAISGGASRSKGGGEIPPPPVKSTPPACQS